MFNGDYPFALGQESGKEKEEIIELAIIAAFSLSPLAGGNGSHLLCFKPNTSGTKAGTCIVLQSGSEEGNEKTYLNKVVAVPKNASLKTNSLLFERFLFITQLAELQTICS